MEFVGAGNGEAMLAHGGEMGTACHKGDIGVAPGKARTEIASDASRSHHCDFHRHPPHALPLRPASIIVRHCNRPDFAVVRHIAATWCRRDLIKVLTPANKPMTGFVNPHHSPPAGGPGHFAGRAAPAMVSSAPERSTPMKVLPSGICHLAYVP